MKAILNSGAHLFAFLGIIFIPMASYVLPFQNKLAVVFFGDLINLFVEDHLDFTSDTLGLNVLLVVLLVLSLLLAFVLERMNFWKDKREKAIVFIRTILVYYLASRLMVYGFDKVFQTQFYTPEPNTLYTPFGFLEKDILFWSTMGTSKWYCILSGVAEIVPAFLLLFKRTRVLGLFMSSFVLLHVLTINLGFDISVKLYSLFLLFITAIALMPHLKQIFIFFIKHESGKLKMATSWLESKPAARKSLKFFAVGMILIEALKFPISTGYLSDQDVPLPYLHGAYTVKETKSDSGEISGVDHGIERFFIHRRGYFIFQYDDGSLKDYKMKLYKEEQIIELENFENSMNRLPYKLYQGTGIALELGVYVSDWDIIWLSATREDHKSMPALRDDFHWTIDEFNNED